MLKKLYNNNLFCEYEKVFDEWIKEIIIDIVPEKEIRNLNVYLPYRPVIKEGSTIHIRPIFDHQSKEEINLR